MGQTPRSGSTLHAGYDYALDEVSLQEEEDQHRRDRKSDYCAIYSGVSPPFSAIGRSVYGDVEYLLVTEDYAIADSGLNSHGPHRKPPGRLQCASAQATRFDTIFEWDRETGHWPVRLLSAYYAGSDLSMLSEKGPGQSRT